MLSALQREDGDVPPPGRVLKGQQISNLCVRSHRQVRMHFNSTGC